MYAGKVGFLKEKRDYVTTSNINLLCKNTTSKCKSKQEAYAGEIVYLPCTLHGPHRALISETLTAYKTWIQI